MNDPKQRWTKQAACLGMDPDLFMPQRGENKKVQKAKKICRNCPVVNECREYGLELSAKYDTHGIFGGLSKYERAAILKQQGRRIATWNNGTLLNKTL